jgi:geranylgeranyl reductase family protein
MKQPIEADVLIIGAGPAGSMAAITLAGLGIRPVIIEKESFPRDKPCGGGISRRFFTRFPDVSANLEKTIRIHDVRRVVLASPDGTAVRASSSRPLYRMVRRLEFDHALLRLAREKGAAVHEHTRAQDLERHESGCTVRCGGGKTFRCRVLIGADGVNSVAARMTGLRKSWRDEEVAINTMEETPVETIRPAAPDTLHIFYGYRETRGYAYIFPKRMNTDLGTGYLLSHYKDGMKERLYAFHRAFVDEMNERGLIAGSSDRTFFQTCLIPLCGPVYPTFGSRVLLCGDAGGFVNGFTAEGIYYAAVSGFHAGQAAGEAVLKKQYGKDALRSYEAAWQEDIGDELAESVKIGRILFSRPHIINAVVRAARHDDALANLFRDIAIGEATAAANRYRILRRLLRAMLRRRMPLKSLWGILKHRS